MTAPAAHGEEGLSFNLKDLPSHQVNDRWSNPLYLPAVPILYGILSQEFEVLMIAGDEQGSKRLLFQPVQPVPIRGTAVPNTSKVSANDHIVIFAQFRFELLPVK